MPHGVRQKLQQIGVTHQDVMLDAEVLRGRACDRRFVVFFLGEANREGLHFLTKTSNQAREQRIRVKPAAQEQPERDIAAQTETQAFIERRAHLVARVFVAAFQLRPLLVAPVALDRRLSPLPEEIMRGWQFLDLAHDGARRRDESELEISGERFRIDFPRREFLIEQRSEL